MADGNTPPSTAADMPLPGDGSDEVCDGVDNDGDGIVDNRDSERDGVCDCLAIANLGSQYVIALDAVNAGTGESLAREEVQASSKEAVLNSLHQAGSSLRKKLGESLASVQKYDKQLSEATTSSLEALRAYSQGLKTWNTKGEEEALPLLKRALELDPNFASAYASLGAVYQNIERPRVVSRKYFSSL